MMGGDDFSAYQRYASGAYGEEAKSDADDMPQAVDGLARDAVRRACAPACPADARRRRVEQPADPRRELAQRRLACRRPA